MELLRTTRQLGQAVKNAQRLRQILAVFSRKGFADVARRMNLGAYLPSTLAGRIEGENAKNFNIRLREAFEELGPTFVKLGQFLSTRPDLVPDELIEELVKLQDGVLPLPFSTIKQTVEAELKRPITAAYQSFNEMPLASASIGQVHEAVLHTGERVVVKVQRPGIAKVIQTDISLLAFLARMLERYVPESRVMNPSIFVDEFFRTLSLELDYQVEANNMRKMSSNLASIPDIVIPNVHSELTTSRVMTQTKLEGIRVNDIRALDQAGIDRRAIVRLGARAFFKTVMIDGLFHGDLHGGNLFVLPGNKIGMIDFGIVGRLSERSRAQLANMVMAILSEDYETLCYEYAELGQAATSIDFEGFEREIRSTVSPYVGMSMKEVNTGKVLIEATKVAIKYNIKVPGDWMIVFKAMLTMEGMGRTLDPDFDLIAHGQDMIQELLKGQYNPSKMGKELLWLGKDTASLLRVLPRYLRWMFKKFTSNDFAFEVRSAALESIQSEMVHGRKKTIRAIIAAALILASAMTASLPAPEFVAGIPLISFIQLALAAIFAVAALL